MHFELRMSNTIFRRKVQQLRPFRVFKIRHSTPPPAPPCNTQAPPPREPGALSANSTNTTAALPHTSKMSSARRLASASVGAPGIAREIFHLNQYVGWGSDPHPQPGPCPLPAGRARPAGVIRGPDSSHGRRSGSRLLPRLPIAAPCEAGATGSPPSFPPLGARPPIRAVDSCRRGRPGAPLPRGVQPGVRAHCISLHCLTFHRLHHLASAHRGEPPRRSLRGADAPRAAAMGAPALPLAGVSPGRVCGPARECRTPCHAPARRRGIGLAGACGLWYKIRPC
jgi:hypothetical protein